MPATIGKVAVLVDPDDALIDAVLAAGCDVLQLHGEETPERLAAVKARTGREVLACRRCRTRADISGGDCGEWTRGPVAPRRQSLYRSSPLPGGNGLTFRLAVA